MVHVRPLLEIVGNRLSFLQEEVSEEEVERYRQHERKGRLLGDEDFLERIKKWIGRDLRRKNPGPKKNERQC